MKFENKKKYNFDGIRICCRNKEDAARLLKIAHEHGYKWHSGKSYLEEMHWYEGVKETNYDIVRGYYNDFSYIQALLPDDVISFEDFLKTRVLT